jgi:NAD(P)-dependent dehydrogenase (short-subunit alcohol dehydrogenase family)
MNLESSVIIVTGSATGLGSAVARLSASKGAKVVVNYTKSETEAQETASACRELGVETLVCRAGVLTGQQLHAGPFEERQTAGCPRPRRYRWSSGRQESPVLQVFDDG